MRSHIWKFLFGCRHRRHRFTLQCQYVLVQDPACWGTYGEPVDNKLDIVCQDCGEVVTTVQVKTPLLFPMDMTQSIKKVYL